ncbi:hypothetical protein CBD41_07380, partial [bacterium TMED181]
MMTRNQKSRRYSRDRLKEKDKNCRYSRRYRIIFPPLCTEECLFSIPESAAEGKIHTMRGKRRFLSANLQSRPFREEPEWETRTGIEMEALTGVSAGLLCALDMVKSFEKNEEGQYPETRITDIVV